MKSNLFKILVYFVSAFFLLVPGSLHAENKITKIDKLMQRYYDSGLFSGEILVAENDEVIFKRSYGFADLEWNIPNNTDTKFRIGSLTKQFTAMLIMQLVQEGKIELDKTISDYLPTYRKDTGKVVTIHQLLTHTSGIPSYNMLPGFFDKISKMHYSTKKFLDKYCSGDLEFKPGTKFSYSNSGYYILGAIIESVTGKSYEQVLKDKIFNPIEMKNSGYDHLATILKKRAKGYRKIKNSIVNTSYTDMSVPFSAGAIYSTIDDLYLWNQALCSDKLISKKYKKMIFQPYVKADNDYYGYGWFISKNFIKNSKNSVSVAYHSGSINGFHSFAIRDAKNKNLILLLNNIENSPVQDISKSIANILYEK